LKFKAEVVLLALAIALFTVATLFFSYQGTSNQAAAFTAQSIAYPYRGIAFVLLGVGSLSMVTASVSYTRKTKNLIRQKRF
jgi:membrane protein implicated in regulation of membrane protease activity